MLRLCDIPSTRDLSPLSICTGLRELDLSRTEASDLSPLVALRGSLEVLYLEKCGKVSNVGPLSSLLHLKLLDLSYSPVSDLGPLSVLTTLEDLQLGA